MLKEKLKEGIKDTSQYSGVMVKNLIEQVTGFKQNPTSIMIYDVIVLKNLKKPRPGIVLKKFKDYVIVLPLTTTVHYYTGVSHNCRLFGEGYIAKHFYIVPMDEALENFTGIFTDKKAVKEAKELLKTIIGTL